MDEWKEALDNEDNEELRDLFEFDQRPMRILAKKLPKKLMTGRKKNHFPS
ncbi:unnamed protein product [Durusdinium trenchii]|uniref:Uncharacterized protein n=1 Tax=Durusdinium trenchii TaxID=1381693 RepID=A0ABP0LET7_9DINO